jgi:hypothetical protein
MFFNLSKLLLCMKLTIIFIIAGCLSLSARTTAQVTVSVKNEPLAKVFKMITRQSGYQFFYSERLLAKAHPVTVDVRNQPLQKALELCFEGQPLTYSII